MDRLNTSIRPSPIAGRWYPGDPEELAAEVDGYIQKASLPMIKGNVLAVVSPHAGYLYSGHVAGHAFAAIQDQKPDIVLVVSPLHQPSRGSIFTTAYEAYWTPLGKIPVATDLIDEINQSLKNHGSEPLTSLINDQEHSLEIELPFLQRIYKHPFRLFPIMVREQSIEELVQVSEILAEVLSSQRIIAVASTDLSHFYTQKDANRLDEQMLSAILDLSPQQMVELENTERGFACGLGAVMMVIYYARLCGANQATLLKYATSGDITGDNSSVVGYGAIAIARTSS